MLLDILFMGGFIYLVILKGVFVSEEVKKELMIFLDIFINILWFLYVVVYDFAVDDLSFLIKCFN